MKKRFILIQCYYTDLIADIILTCINKVFCLKNQDSFYEMRQKSLGFYQVIKKMLNENNNH
jgi:hypothetical protein